MRLLHRMWNSNGSNDMKPEDFLDKDGKRMIEEAIRENDADHTEEEIGDLLFSVVNLARYLSLRPNTAMMRANRKVRARFQKLFDLARIRDIPIDKNHVDQMNDLWEEIKVKEKMATDS